MIRSELIQKIADENPHLYQRDVERIVNTIFEEIIEAMARGDRVELRGFGAFSVKKREARIGRMTMLKVLLLSKGRHRQHHHGSRARGVHLDESWRTSGKKVSAKPVFEILV